jgi:uncharacterized membrane protein YesL
MVVLNLLWAVLALPWLVSAALAVGWGVPRGPLWTVVTVVVGVDWVAFSPPTALLFVAAARWQQDADVTLRDLLRVGSGPALRAQLLGLAHVLAGAVLGANALFYLDRGGTVGLAVGYAYGWLLAATLLLVPYVLATLALWPLTAWAALRTSFLLAVGRPAAALVLGLAGALLAAAALLTGVGLVAGLVSAWALMAVTVVAQQAARRAGQPLPPVPERSWSEVLRPWETK